MQSIRRGSSESLSRVAGRPGMVIGLSPSSLDSSPKYKIIAATHKPAASAPRCPTSESSASLASSVPRPSKSVESSIGRCPSALKSALSSVLLSASRLSAVDLLPSYSFLNLSTPKLTKPPAITAIINAATTLLAMLSPLERLNKAERMNTISAVHLKASSPTASLVLHSSHIAPDKTDYRRADDEKDYDESQRRGDWHFP